MKIFISCQQSLKNHPVPAYQFWENYFKKGIEEANHQWVEAEGIDWAEGLINDEAEKFNLWRDRTWESTVEQIKKQHQQKGIDLFLSYLYPQQISTSAIKEIQNLGIPCVNFFCDNVREFTKVPSEFYCFDLNWVPEYKALKIYHRAGLNYIHAPMPVWVDPKYRNHQHQEKYGTTFIGSQDKQRAALFSEVLKLGVELEIRGPRWSEEGNTNSNESSKIVSRKVNQTLINQINFLKSKGVCAWLRKTQSKWQQPIDLSIFAPSIHPTVTFDEYIKVTQESKIILGVNRYPSFRHSFTNPDTYSRLRDIEAPMVGGCYLTEWTEGIEQMYELGKEIETYRNPEEMKEKICELEAKPEKRSQMRRLAQKKALEKLSFPQTLRTISQSLAL